MDSNVSLRDGYTLLSHQRSGVQWMIDQERGRFRGGILADEPGMGKTIMTIGLCLGNRVPRTLIIAPKSVVPQWCSEIKRFSDLSVDMIERSTPAPEKPSELPEVTVASYAVLLAMRNRRKRKAPPADLVAPPARHWVTHVQWDRIVLDEAHLIKNHRSQTARGALHLSQGASKFALTGTPIQNTRGDLIALATWIGYYGSDQLPVICGDILLRRTIDQVPDFTLPALTVQMKIMEFSEEEREMYNSVENYARKRVAKALRASGKNPLEILEAILRCRQLCSHPQIFIEGMRKKFSMDYEDDFEEDEIDRDWTGPTTKMQTLVELLKVVPEEEKSIVFCSFVSEMHLYRDAIEATGIETRMFHGQMNNDARLQTLEEFRADPNVRVMLVQIVAGGQGLNLQDANNIFITSPQWNPMWEVQAMGRCYRHGQKRPVQLVRLVVKDTIEERICEIQDQKLAMVSSALSDPRIASKLAGGNMTLTVGDVKRMFRRTS